MQSIRIALLLFFCLSSLVAAQPARAQTTPSSSAPTEQSATPASTTAPSAASAASLVTQPAALPNPTTPAEFFARARQLSDLEASGIPFHLKATFVATGDTKITGNGTIEEWWASKDLWRKEATLGSYRWVSVKHEGNWNLYTSSGYPPLRLKQAMDVVLIRIAPNIGTSNDWKTEQKTIKKITFEILSAAYPDPNPLGEIAKRDYFTPEGVLRIRQTTDTVILYNNFQQFQNLVIPRKIDVSSGAVPWLAISIETLEPFSASAATKTNLSSVPQGLMEVSSTRPGPHRIVASSGAMASKILYSQRPVYPDVAKQRWIQGTVVLAATIDEEGKIRNLHVVQSAGALLDAAAFQAVRQWRYRPTMLAGVPVKVNTQISVVFTLNR